MTIRQAQRYTQERLRAVAAQHEARFFVQALTALSWEAIFSAPDQALSFAQQCTLRDWIDQRLAGRPIQYILGKWEFMGLTMLVEEGVLIPRQDTETLIALALQRAKDCGCRSVLDLCCGSGCIGIAMAKLGGLSVTSVDISSQALALTQKNAAFHQVALHMGLGDLFDALENVENSERAVDCGNWEGTEKEEKGAKRFDLIVSNPPYIKHGDIAHLDETVRSYEPILALDGGDDGLSFYRRIAMQSMRYLHPQGALFLEIGYNQAADVCTLFANRAWKNPQVFKDINGQDRVLLIERHD